MRFIITSSLSPKAVPSVLLTSCRKAPKDHLFLSILPSVSVQLLQCKRIATFLFKHISQCLNNWKSIFRKQQLKTRHFLCIYNMFNNCKSLNFFCEYCTQTVQASVEDQRSLSLATLSSFSSLIGYCACLLRVRTAQIVACLAWHLFPLIAATNHCGIVFWKCLRSWLGLCTHLTLFSFCSGRFI